MKIAFILDPLPKLKIDVLMGVSMVEHKARQTVDEWHIAHPAPV